MEMNDRPTNGKGRKAAKEAKSEQSSRRESRRRAEAVAQMEQRLGNELEQKLQAAQVAIAKSIQEFAEQRNDYFTKVEAEIVQLALSIAAKILHREAQVDPMLVATLVRMAVERMRDQSSVTFVLRLEARPRGRNIFPGNRIWPMCRFWKMRSSAQRLRAADRVGLGELQPGITVERMEQGFFDLLALRPAR